MVICLLLNSRGSCYTDHLTRPSRTLIFDAPRHARGFFEALIADNFDIGRPHNVEIIFGRRVRRDTPGTFRTAIDRRDNGGVIVNVFYKHSRIKQYLKDGRAMRIETIINSFRGLGCQARLPNLEELQAKAVPATSGSCMLNESVRAVSLRVQRLSGSRTPPSMRRDGGPQPCGLAILGSWP
jgi:hypothetical protein